MQIKKFKADDMARALRLIKNEFGPEAVILSARSLKKEKGVFGVLAKHQVEVTAATDAYYPQDKKDRSTDNRVSPYEYPPLGYSMNGLDNKKGGLISSIHGGVKALRDKYKFAAPEKDDLQNISKELLMLRKHLLSQGVEENVADELIEKMNKARLSKDSSEGEDLKSCLVRIISETGIAIGPKGSNQKRKRIIALVGPTGVGKTTTISKLAALHALEMKKRVGLVTLDNHRIAGIEQIGIFARIMGVPMEVASNNKELKRSLKKLKDRDTVLIDTAGMSQRDGYRFDELKNLFDKMRHIEVQLLLSATTKENDLTDILDKFKAISFSGVIFTKLDESISYGNIFNLLIRKKLPISYFAEGQQVPGDLEAASLEKLVDLIMDGNKGTEFVNRTLRTINHSGKKSGRSRQNSGKTEQVLKTGASVSKSHSDEFYVANKNSDIFHHPDCKWANKIKSANLVMFESALEAINKNYKPCRLCKPGKIEKYETIIPESERMEKISSYGY